MNADKFGHSHSAKAMVQRKEGNKTNTREEFVDGWSPKGFFTIEHIRGGKTINKFKVNNGVTNVGKNYGLDVAFRSATTQLTWYIGLIDNSGFTALADADTMSSHAGWTENTGYSDGTRIAWGPDAAASQSTTNSTAATFNINATNTMNGIFVTSDSTKSGTSGTLWSTASFASTIAVNNGDQLKVTYTVNATAS